MLHTVDEICETKCGHNDNNNNSKSKCGHNEDNSSIFFGSNVSSSALMLAGNIRTVEVKLETKKKNNTDSSSYNISRLQNNNANTNQSVATEKDCLMLFERCSSSPIVDSKRDWNADHSGTGSGSDDKANQNSSKSLGHSLCKHIKRNRSSSQVLDLRRTKSTTGIQKYDCRLNDIGSGIVTANGTYKMNKNYRHKFDDEAPSAGADANQSICTNNMDNDGVCKSSVTVTLRRPYLSVARAKAAVTPTTAGIIERFNASSVMKHCRPETPQTASDGINSVRIGVEHTTTTTANNIGAKSTHPDSVVENDSNKHIDQLFNGNETYSMRQLKANTNPFLDHEIIESECAKLSEAQQTNGAEKSIPFSFITIDFVDDRPSMKGTTAASLPATMCEKSNWFDESNDDYGNELFNHKSCVSRHKQKQKHNYQTTYSSSDSSSDFDNEEQLHSAMKLSAIKAVGIGIEHPKTKNTKSSRRRKFVYENASEATFFHNHTSRNRCKVDRGGQSRHQTGNTKLDTSVNDCGVACSEGGSNSSSKSSKVLDVDACQTTKSALNSTNGIPTCPFFRQDYGAADESTDQKHNNHKSKKDCSPHFAIFHHQSDINSGENPTKFSVSRKLWRNFAKYSERRRTSCNEDVFFAEVGAAGAQANNKTGTTVEARTYPRLKKLNISYPNRTQLIDDAEPVYRYEPNVFDKTKESLIKIGLKCGLKWQGKYNATHSPHSGHTEIDATRPLSAYGPTTITSRRIAKALYKNCQSEIASTQKLNYLDAFLSENFTELPQPHSDSHKIDENVLNSTWRDDIVVASKLKRNKSCTKAIGRECGAYELSRKSAAGDGNDFEIKSKLSYSVCGRDDYGPIAGTTAYISSSYERNAKSHTTSSSLNSSDYASAYNPCRSSSGSGAQLIDQQTIYSSGSCYLSKCNNYVGRCDATTTLDAGAANVPLQYDKRQKNMRMNHQHNDDNNIHSLAFNGSSGATRPSCDSDGQDIIDRQKLTISSLSLSSSSLSSSASASSSPIMKDQSLYQYENQLTFSSNNDAHLAQVYHQQHQRQRQPTPIVPTATANQFYAHKITIRKQHRYSQHHVVITKPKNSCSSSDVVLEYEC